jgi:ribosomal protein L6P/L9E
VGDSVGMVRTRVARRSKDAVAGLLGARLRNMVKGLVRRHRR